MEIKELNIRQFKEMMTSGVNNLIVNVDKINKLNVFPVPDGDTGTNMAMTLKSGLMETENLVVNSISEYMKFFSKGTLMGARGNSGVILSQIIKGMSNTLMITNKNKLTVKEFCLTFPEAKKIAYQSVQKPVEGTILTVTSDLSKNSKLRKGSFKNFQELFHHIEDVIDKSVKNTPNLLAVLKESGVVDSGAYGLKKFFQGMSKYLEGNEVKLLKNQEFISDEVVKANPNINIGYCTEFIISLKKNNLKIKDKIKKILELYGDSIVIVQDEDIIKIHVHSKNPGNLMQEMHKFGQFSKIKIENMTTQISETNASINTFKQKENIGIISVVNGVGLEKEFIELGCNHIIKGGQSMNPSTQDFLSVINSIETKNIIILPNNSNIISVANQAAKMFKTSEKKIVVIPTISIQSGMVGMYNFSQDINFEDNIVSMESAIKVTQFSSITKAIKDAKVGKIKIKKGDYISIVKKEIKFSNSSLEKITKETINHFISNNKDLEIITIFIGDRDSKNIKNKLKSYISKLEDIEFEIKVGGQPIYELLIMAE